MVKSKFNWIPKWIEEAVLGFEYGTIELTITVHNGEIRFIEKKVSEKVLLGGEHEKRKS